MTCVLGALALADSAGEAIAGHHGARAGVHRHGHRRHAHRRGHKSRGHARQSTLGAYAGSTLASAPSAPATPQTAASGSPTPPRLVWSDEFNGPAGASPDPAKWSFDVGGGGWGNGELEYYTSRPLNAELDGWGDLVITARKEAFIGPDGVHREYTSARLETLRTFHFLYGAMEARIQVPAGAGLLPAFWSLGDDAYSGADAWPACGEIDAMEVVGSTPNVVSGTLHAPWPWAPKEAISGSFVSPTTLSDGFHVYAAHWAPESIDFSIDGHVYETVSRGSLPQGAVWPFGHPNFLLLDLAVGGRWPGAPTSSTPLPARMLVDWVRVWQ